MYNVFVPIQDRLAKLDFGTVHSPGLVDPVWVVKNACPDQKVLDKIIALYFKALLR